MTALTRSAPSITSDRVWKFVREKGVYLALAVVVIFNLIATPNFASLRNLQLQLVQVAPVVIVALGMALVIGTAGIDLSVGAVMALAAAMVAIFVDQSPWLAIAMALVVGVVAGSPQWVSGGVPRHPAHHRHSRPVRGRARHCPRVHQRTTGRDLRSDAGAIGQNRLWGVPIGALIAGILAVATAVLVRQTRFGRNVIAIGGNPRAALGAGLPIRRVLLAVYVVCAVFAAIAGMLVTARSAAADPSFVGLLIELSAITAVVVGGTPLRGGKVRILGTVAGALLMQLVFSTLIRHDLSDSDARMVQAAIIIAAVYFQRDRGAR